MNTTADQHTGSPAEPGKGPSERHLHIFVNRRKFGTEDGVMPIMSGRDIAALVEVPPELAIIRRGEDGNAPQIGLDDHIEIREGEHFLVTRSTVEGGCK